MPEGHTIHRFARSHSRLFKGRKLSVSSPQGRFVEGAAIVDGRVLRAVEPYGKHLFYRFDGVADRLHVHLGLFGKFRTGVTPPPDPVGALRLLLVSDDAWVELRGPTACELVTPAEHAAILDRLGPDPLVNGMDDTPAWTRISRSRTAIGALLMNQAVIAGVGNVYRAEILFRHGIDPHRPGRDLTRADWDAIWADLCALMRDGVRRGAIVTTRVEDRERRSGRVTRADSHYVYRRAGLPCRLCGAPIVTEVMAGRNLYRCPHDQV